MLPPQWQQIPLRNGTETAVRNILDGAFSRLRRDLPRDKLAPYRGELERRLAQLAAQARRNGGTCLYLPVEPMHGIPVAASFVVSEGSIGAGTIDPGLIAAHLADGSNGPTPVTADGATAIRIERIAPPDPANEIDHRSHRVDYVISVPGQDDRWLIVAFSTIGSGDPDGAHAKLLVELFDAIMSTFRWTGV